VVVWRLRSTSSCAISASLCPSAFPSPHPSTCRFRLGMRLVDADELTVPSTWPPLSLFHSPTPETWLRTCIKGQSLAFRHPLCVLKNLQRVEYLLGRCSGGLCIPCDDGWGSDGGWAWVRVWDRVWVWVRGWVWVDGVVGVWFWVWVWVWVWD